MNFTRDSMPGSYSNYGGMYSQPEGAESIIGQRRVASSLQGIESARRQSDINMISGTLGAISQQEAAKEAAAAYRRSQGKQPSGASSIISGALGLGSLATAFFPGTQGVSKILGATSSMVGQYGPNLIG